MKSHARKARDPLPAARLETMAQLLRVVGHPARLRILDFLETESQAPVHAITAAAGQPQASVSNHLTKMRQAGILNARRRGKEVWYAIASPHAVTILKCMRHNVAGSSLQYGRRGGRST